MAIATTTEPSPYPLEPDEPSPHEVSNERFALLGHAPLTLDRDATGRSHLWLLLALTLLGGILRFFRVGHPTFWIDEAFTYWRICGSYQELIDILREGGFTPLHYEAYWLLGRFTTLSPFFMRLIPAVCGTLMIPAMYFLARQVANRNTALLTAALTACSAYMLNYSRDSKMYMDAWLFAALHLGCLMWWLRTRRTLAWLAWVAAGLAMGGIHATSLILMVIEPVLLITSQRLRWWHTLAFLGGVALVAAGPGGYYVMFNQWTERIEAQGWRASGLFWVNWFNSGRDGVIDNLRYPASAFLFNWEWPKLTEEAKIAPAVLYWYKTLAFALAVLIGAGLFPWRSLTARRPQHHFIDAGDANTPSLPVPWWRGTFWIATWIVLPLFVFHLISAGRVVSPLEGWAVLRDWFDTPGRVTLAAIVAVAAFSCCGLTLRERVGKTVALLLILAGLFVLCLGIGALIVFRNTESVWVPRYLGVVWPALAIAACASIMRLPGWPLRASAIVLLLGLNLTNGLARMTHFTQPPLDRIANDVVLGENDVAVRTFISSPRGEIFSPGLLNPEGRYYLIQAATNSGTPVPWARKLDEFSTGFWLLDHPPGPRMKPGDFLESNFDFRSGSFEREFGTAFNIGTGPAFVRPKVEASPHVKRVILWDQFFGRPPNPVDDDESADPIVAALGSAWRRSAVEEFPVYKNFCWEWTHTWRKREYVREGKMSAATTAPTTTSPVTTEPAPSPAQQPAPTQP